MIEQEDQWRAIKTAVEKVVSTARTAQRMRAPADRISLQQDCGILYDELIRQRWIGAGEEAALAMGIAARLEDVIRTPGDYGVHFIAALEAELPKIDQVIKACPYTVNEVLSKAVKGKIERAFPPPLPETPPAPPAKPKKKRKAPANKGVKSEKTQRVELLVSKGMSNQAIVDRLENKFPNINPHQVATIRNRMKTQEK